MSLKRSLADRLFSKYIRVRDKFTCQRCGKRFAETSQGLHAAHIHSRAKKSVRFEPDNAVALCFPCHTWCDQHKTEFFAWVRERLGPSRYDLLHVKAQKPSKVVDEAMAVLWLRQALADR